MVDVVFHQMAPHPLHTRAPLCAAHLESLMNGLRNAGYVIGIDYQGISQFNRSASELAQHEHAVFVVARSQKFLGHQVHSVVQ